MNTDFVEFDTGDRNDIAISRSHVEAVVVTKDGRTAIHTQNGFYHVSESYVTVLARLGFKTRGQK